jgi:hypothetical protein
MSANSGGPPAQTRPKERGLPSLNDARLTRRRSIVLGRVRLREVATRFWLFTFVGMALFGVVYYRHAQNELATQRNQLAARQRAVAVAAGQAGFALRDKLEAWVTELAQSAEPAPLVAASASLDEISRGPGIYVRAARSEAREAQSLRKAAAHSLRDGFTSCLFIGRAPDPVVPAVACKSKSQCGPGELCDDWGLCAPPGQPYNLRLLYDALRIQGPEWEQRLAATGDELQVRAMELELDDTAKHELPAAAELIRRSRYFSAVLDEDGPDALARANGADAGVYETPEERLQTTDHFVRIGIWDLAKSEPLLRLRLPVAGRFVALGAHGDGGVAEARARQRQANNCAAAVEVREALLSRLGSTVSASDALDDPAGAARPSP